jgi:hypothetical protein
MYVLVPPAFSAVSDYIPAGGQIEPPPRAASSKTQHISPTAQVASSLILSHGQRPSIPGCLWTLTFAQRQLYRGPVLRFVCEAMHAGEGAGRRVYGGQGVGALLGL